MTMLCSSRCERIAVRGMRYNVRHWGSENAPRMFMLHGWMDSSATFQFVVDAFSNAWHVIAPDLRGFGESEWMQRPYWFPDYYADLECVLDHYSPEIPVRLVGHSMGANIAATYAAARPGRVKQVAMLDFLGLLASEPEDAPGRLAGWLDELRTAPRMRVYRDRGALVRRLMAANGRLTLARAEFLAEHVARVREDGQIEMACDPWHKMVSPTLYRVEESMAAWRAINVPVLMLVANEGYVHDRFGGRPDELRRRLDCFRNATVVTVEGAGHNLQHDQPERVAAALERFLSRD